MKRKSYSLPRHTNLAKQGSRTGAFLIDFAIFLLITLVMLFGCFNFIFKSTVTPYNEEIEKESINSHLRFKNEDGDLDVIANDASYEEFRDVISYYYLNYLTGEVETPGTGSRLSEQKVKLDSGEEVSKKDFYTVGWFNKNVLGIQTNNPENEKDCLFTYVFEGDSYNFDKFGIPKDEVDAPISVVNSYMQEQFLKAYYDFTQLSYIVDLTNKINFIYSLEFVLSAIIGAVVTYLLIPYLIKNGRTVGKKVFGLALANSDGYKMENKQLFMRIMPLIVCLLAFLIPIWIDLFLILLMPLMMFLISFALSMASPRRASLHDFCARTIVIDERTSTIFENEIEEEAYLLKEELGEVVDVKEVGEEPGISYEK